MDLAASLLSKLIRNPASSISHWFAKDADSQVKGTLNVPRQWSSAVVVINSKFNLQKVWFGSPQRLASVQDNIAG